MRENHNGYTRRQALSGAVLGIPAVALRAGTGIPPELREATKRRVKTTGIGQDKILERHDPSNLIRHKGKYYLWYTEHPPKSGFIGTYVQLATSPDGTNWTIQGTALRKGKPGEPDAQGALTAYVVPHERRFYMFYTRVPSSFHNANQSKRGIGFAVADSPDGPWEKQPETILWPGENTWDDLCCDDTNIIYRAGKWWLYYKGRTLNDSARDSRIGLAISDKLTGPYRKHPANPLFRGHAFSAWVHRSGVAAVGGETNHSVLWSSDGIHFEVASEFDNKSTGFYCPENFGDGTNYRGVSWGFDVARAKPRYLYRFDCNLIVRK